MGGIDLQRRIVRSIQHLDTVRRNRKRRLQRREERPDRPQRLRWPSRHLLGETLFGSEKVGTWVTCKLREAAAIRRIRVKQGNAGNAIRAFEVLCSEDGQDWVSVWTARDMGPHWSASSAPQAGLCGLWRNAATLHPVANSEVRSPPKVKGKACLRLDAKPKAPLEEGRVTLVLPGTCSYVFWQLGRMIQYLCEHFDTRSAKLAGVSSGTVGAVMLLQLEEMVAAAADSDSAGVAAAVRQRAHQIFGIIESKAAQNMASPTAFVGRLGTLMDILAAELLSEGDYSALSSRMRIGVRRLATGFVPAMVPDVITSFSTREELLESVMASCNVWLVVRFKPWRYVPSLRAFCNDGVNPFSFHCFFEYLYDLRSEMRGVIAANHRHGGAWAKLYTVWNYQVMKAPLSVGGRQKWRQATFMHEIWMHKVTGRICPGDLACEPLGRTVTRSAGSLVMPPVQVPIGGDVHSWGSGEMGQLGFPLLEDLPKDQDGYPYEPTAGLIKAFKRIKICQIAGGDGHTAAVTVHGKLYSWGASACGQLGHCDTAHMPKDVEGYPYQPVPLLVGSLQETYASSRLPAEMRTPLRYLARVFCTAGVAEDVDN
ncbi:unnamed protein product [Effrenium voratum]|nr:unnamed protein product [Effrenium voratum]